MTLHDQMEAAIKERLAVAQAALVVWPQPDFYAIRPQWFGHINGPQWFGHINANGPDRIIRDCTEDLAMLDRHRMAPTGSHLFCGPDCQGGDCGSCGVNYPCIETQSLARRYGITEATDG